MTDCLVTMFEDLRKQRPPCYDADRWQAWIAQMREAVQALPRFDQRWASVGLLADDLMRAMPGMPLPMAFGWLSRNLLTLDDQVAFAAVKEAR